MLFTLIGNSYNMAPLAMSLMQKAIKVAKQRKRCVQEEKGVRDGEEANES